MLHYSPSWPDYQARPRRGCRKTPAIPASAPTVVLLYRTCTDRLRFVGAGLKPAPTPRPSLDTLAPTSPMIAETTRPRPFPQPWASGQPPPQETQRGGSILRSAKLAAVPACSTRAPGLYLLADESCCRAVLRIMLAHLLSRRSADGSQVAFAARCYVLAQAGSSPSIAGPYWTPSKVDRPLDEQDHDSVGP